MAVVRIRWRDEARGANHGAGEIFHEFPPLVK